MSILNVIHVILCVFKIDFVEIHMHVWPLFFKNDDYIVEKFCEALLKLESCAETY